MIRQRVVVSGLVQGVGYRASCARVAAGLGVSGYVRNLDDGRVEIVAKGPRDAVESLVEWCRRGPLDARVDRAVITDQPTGTEGVVAEGFAVIH